MHHRLENCRLCDRIHGYFKYWKEITIPSTNGGERVTICEHCINGIMKNPYSIIDEPVSDSRIVRLERDLDDLNRRLIKAKVL